MKIVLKRFKILGLIVWLASFSIGWTQEYPEIMFVVDSSGSMTSQNGRADETGCRQGSLARRGFGITSGGAIGIGRIRSSAQE